jgi:NAD-dependent dihydropyrimidine dehydrogenase PreA subunit
MKMYKDKSCVDVHPAKVHEMKEKGWSNKQPKKKKESK